MQEQPKTFAQVLAGLLKSRKTVLVLICVTVATVLVALGKIEVDQFLATVTLLFGGLAALIGLEDAADKHGRGKASPVTQVNAPAAREVTVQEPSSDPLAAIERTDPDDTARLGRAKEK